MKKIGFFIFLVLIPFASNCQDIEFGKRMGYDIELKEVKSIFVHTSIQTDVESIDREELHDFIMLRLLRDFEDNVKIKRMADYIDGAFHPTNEWHQEVIEGDRPVILFRYRIWTVGNDYPVAYHINYEFGTFLSNDEMIANENLGFIIEDELNGKLKEIISSHVNEVAIYFYKMIGKI